MATPGVLAAVDAIPTSITPGAIGVAEGSPAQLFMYDGLSALWWRFTAPSTGAFAFDAGLCTVAGVTSATEPYATVDLLNAAGENIGSGPFTFGGTSLAWNVTELAAGESVYIRLVAVSSLADYGADTQRFVSVRLRSNDIDSVQVAQPAVIGTTQSTSGTSSDNLALPAGTQVNDLLIVGAYSNDTLSQPNVTVTGTILRGSTESWDGFVLRGGTYSAVIQLTALTDVHIDYGPSGGAALCVVVRSWYPGVTLPGGAGPIDERRFLAYTQGFEPFATIAGRSAVDDGPTYTAPSVTSMSDDFVPTGFALFIASPPAAWGPTYQLTPGGLNELATYSGTGTIQVHQITDAHIRMTRPFPDAGGFHVGSWYPMRENPSYVLVPVDVSTSNSGGAAPGRRAFSPRR